MHGAAEAALAAARGSVRSELGAPAPPPERLGLQAPPVQLSEDLLGLARRLAGAAVQGCARCRLYDAPAPAPQVRLLDGARAGAGCACCVPRARH